MATTIINHIIGNYGQENIIILNTIYYLISSFFLCKNTKNMICQQVINKQLKEKRTIYANKRRNTIYSGQKGFIPLYIVVLTNIQ